MSGALGLDVGGTTLKLVVLAADDDVLHTERMRVPDHDVLGFVVSTAVRMVEEHGVDSVGVGLAGLVAHPEGDFVWGPHLAGAAVPYRSVLDASLGFSTAVDNDANLAAFAEWAIGAGERSDPLVMLTLGTGIGAGLVIGGAVYRGTSFAGEAGHIEIVADGERCSCGRFGCWETLVSGTTLDRAAVRIAADEPNGMVARLATGSEPTGAHLAEAAGSGDLRAVQVIGEAGRWLGRGMANLVLLLDPACIVIGGAAAAAGAALLGPARAVLREAMSGSAFRPPVRVVPARFGPLAGAVGAALAGREVQNGAHG